MICVLILCFIGLKAVDVIELCQGDLAGSVVLVATPLAWYEYQLFRGKSPRQIHEERLHNDTKAKETKKEMKNMIIFYKDEAAWRSWLDWDMDKIDDTVNKWYEEGTSRFRTTYEETKKGV